MYFNTPEKYHIYEISRDNLHMKDTYIDTQPHIRSITRNLHRIIVHTPPPHFPFPSTLYIINTGVRTLHMHNIHTQGKTTTYTLAE
jgi:hypothetical protein